MTKKLYYETPYATIFQGTIISCEKGKVGYETIMNQTLFYPEGGGQPGDIGHIDGIEIFDARMIEGDVVHYSHKPFEVGSIVTGEINWDYRFDLMQNHTGEHIISGVICEEYGYDNVGFHMGKEKITIDFNGKIEENQLYHLEQKANEAIWKNIPVGIQFHEGQGLEEMNYRSKIPLEGAVRIVTVDKYDCCACCGLHVGLAGEIGIIKIIGQQSYKGGTRLDILCGKRALNHYYIRNQVSEEVGYELSVSGEFIVQGVSRLIEEKNQLIQSLNKMKLENFEMKIERILFQKKEEDNKIFVVEDGLEGKDITRFSDLLLEKTGAYIGVLSGESFALLSPKKEARGLLEEMKQVFDCKGGGKPEAVQGKINGDKNKIKEFFREQGFFIVE